MSGFLVKRRFRRLTWALFAVALAAGIAASYVAYNVAVNRAHEEISQTANEALALQVETLNGLLEKYRLLPPLLSHRDDIRAVFENPWTAENRELVSAKAVQIAGFSGARDVVFADMNGRIFGSARGVYDESTIEQSQLFLAARQGRLGRETRSSRNGERSYVFASAISEGGEVVGVIAVYVLFDSIEATWSLTGHPFAATISDGLVFLSNRPGWRLRPLLDTGAHGQAVLEALDGGREGLLREPETGSIYLQARREMPLLEWDLHVFIAYEPVLAAGRRAALMAAAFAGFAWLVAWFLIQRRAAFANRLRKDRATSLRLERLVRDRTAELRSTNDSLAREVDVRSRAELELRNTQNELIQAAKLAALGQMSAALSHEFNQPLAAIATQADNARRLIERGKAPKAADAVARISGLVGRMSELSRTLLTFARKPGTAIGPVSLRLVVDEALVLVAPRAKKHQVRIVHDKVDGSHIVMGGRIRLTQVVINLVNNSIDALVEAGRSEPRITIAAHHDGGNVCLEIEDNGPGIPAELRDRIIDPFFTTKRVGDGLGIGLSVVFNIVRDFGGTIAITDASGGGARFEVVLKSGQAETGDEPDRKVAAE